MCKQVSEQMAEPGADMDALMTRMDRLQTQIEAADGWELERQLERAMDALRCPPGKQNMPYCSPIPSKSLPACGAKPHATHICCAWFHTALEAGATIKDEHVLQLLHRHE